MSFRDRDLRGLREARTRLLDRPLGLYAIVRSQAARRGSDHFPALLCMAACRAVGGEKEQAVPVAIGLDLAAAAFALHDRLGTGRLPQDLRRYGQPQAINAGDALFSLARLSLLEMETSGATPEQVSTALHLLDQACLCGGRGRSIGPDQQPSRLDADDVRGVAWDKAGALWGCATQIGAMLGGAGEPVAARLHAFGENLGMARFFIKFPDIALRDQVSGLYAVALAELEGSVPAAQQQELRHLADAAVRGKPRGDTP